MKKLRIIAIIVLIILIGVIIAVVVRKTNLNNTSEANNNETTKTEGTYWDSVLDKAKENPDDYKYQGQSSSDIGLEASGEPVNMDNWEVSYSPTNDNEITLRGQLDSESEYDSVYKDTSVTNIVIPQYIILSSTGEYYKVTIIGENAFNLLENLTSVTIPNSIESIEKKAFNGCSSLTDIYYNGTIEQWNEITIDSDNAEINNATIHCSDGNISANSQ